MSLEGTYLEKIIAAKRATLEGRPGANVNRRRLEAEVASMSACRDFEGALRVGVAPRVIAEFKRASPSEGTIREHADPGAIAKAYADAGAAAMSCLTDPHFEGSFDDLRAVRSAVDLPVLCKDFMLRPSQLLEARRQGADCILLIVAALEPPTLRGMIKEAQALGLHILCETHDEREIERALAAGARMIGVNNRDLHTFEVDVNRAIRLRSCVPKSFTYVAESGIKTREEVQAIRAAGVDAILVGTTLMRAEDPGLALSDLMAL
jgi:indole-3-glycerol phosphate synthase